jgi:hypothetical protein
MHEPVSIKHLAEPAELRLANIHHEHLLWLLTKTV